MLVLVLLAAPGCIELGPLELPMGRKTSGLPRERCVGQFTPSDGLCRFSQHGVWGPVLIFFGKLEQVEKMLELTAYQVMQGAVASGPE